MQPTPPQPVPVIDAGGSPAPAAGSGSHRQLSYPRLRSNTPLLRRTATTLQIGLDDGAVIVEQATGPLEGLLGMLDGCHHLREIHRAAQESALAPPAVDATLDWLYAAGLLTEGRPSPNPAEPAVIRLAGAGHIGRAVGQLLAASGVSNLEIVDDERVDPLVYPGHPASGTQAGALRALLEGGPVHRSTRVTQLGAMAVAAGRPASPVRSSAMTVGNSGGSPAPLLTVVASDMLEADRLLTDALLRADQPHLLVRASGAGMDVGPLVLPGRTACVRCADLLRRDLDPAWPTLLPQLCRVRATFPPPLVGWAAGVAATQVLAFLAGRRPESAGATIELSGHDYATRLRAWNPHPECGCGWRVSAQ